MLKRYPETIRWRQALPPLLVASLLLLGVLSVWLELARAALILEISLYFLTLLAAGILSALQKQKPFLIVGLPICVAVMHLAWGGGFLWSWILSPLIQSHG